MVISIEEFVKREWPQNCGDILYKIQKINEGEYKGKYRCIFKQNPFVIYATKDNIIKGKCINPLLEEINFKNKLWPQKCGDTLRIVRKTNKKDNNGNYLWECEFVKYPYKILIPNKHIKNGLVNNPLIEENEFIGQIFPQNCGDSLLVIEKTNLKNSDNKYLFKCVFLKYPYEILISKAQIKMGSVLNPQIEIEEFKNKIWPQNCGDSLRILEKITEGENKGKWKCEFIKYPCEIILDKDNIIRGKCVNFKLPWNYKEGLLNIIKENFKDKKPSLEELSDYLQIAYTTISHKINEFELNKYIKYDFDKQENIIYLFINSFYKGKIIKGENNILKNPNREIDIYLPDLKIGFEFNGSYWHSELYKEPNYHQEKTLLAKKQGIKLFHIFEYEWLGKKDILQYFIKCKLGIFTKKIQGRKCKIEIIQNKEYQNFCNENHLQGEAGAKIKLGLYYEGELVQIMSFGVPRFTYKYEWEIIRECSKLGYCILGGKQKLWSYFLKYYNPKSVISYCDFSKFTGESYLKLGFKFKQLNKSGFVWWDKNTNEIFWRNPYEHNKMKEKYLKIYDAGQLVFVWEKDKI